MAVKDDMVVADGMGEEVGGRRGVGKADELLGAAEVGLGKVLLQLAFADEMVSEVARYLKEGNGARLHVTSYADADA